MLAPPPVQFAAAGDTPPPTSLRESRSSLLPWWAGHVFDWAPFRSTKASIKLHTLLDLSGALSGFIRVSDGKNFTPTCAKPAAAC